MKKITFIFALLCASVMGWATTYCESTITAVDGTHTASFTCKKTGDNTYTIVITSNESTDITNFNAAPLWMHVNGSETYHVGENFTRDGNTVTATVTSSSVPDFYTSDFYFYYPGEVHFILPINDIDFSATCTGGSTPDPDPTPDPTPVVNPYCNLEIGHMANPNADANSFILLSVGSDGNGHTIVNIKQDNAKNSAMFDYINIVDKKSIGADVVEGGSDEMAIIFNTPTPDGDGNIKFTLQWSTINWGGRWQIENITLPATATCASADPFPGTNAYCKYTDNNLRSGGANVTLTWATNSDGDVVITLGDGEGASNTHFRNEGFEYGGGKTMDDCWFVYSGTKHSVVEPASTYFNAEVAVNGGNTYALRLKDGQSVPANATIAFFGHAFSWKNDQNTNAYTENKWFAYDYGYSCPFLAAPTNVAIDGTKHITFDAVANAQTYTANVYLNGILKHRQVVSSGDELTFQPYTTGTYQVQVVADAAGYPTSDPSEAYAWALTAPAIVVGNSEYCEWALPKHNNQDANLTWETGDDGAITITLSPLSEQTAVFRAEGMKLSDFTVGAAHTAASAYFNRSYTAGGTTVVLTLKDANIAPGLGEKIYFSGYIECKVQNQNTWPNPSLEYTYGSKCSGQKHVTVSVNNNEMGSATVNGETAVDVDENTQVTCVATPAEGYEFVNWTIGGVEVATTATYQPTITAATSLVANFDYARTTYCHTAVQTSGNKKVYLTVGKGATEGTYQIKIYGSAELTITGINNANTAINHVKYLTYDGNDVPLTIANGGWTYSSEGYGVITSAELRPQTNHTWRDMWMWRPDLFMGTSAGQQVINDILDNQHYFNWDNDCSDATAPVFAKAEAEVLNESSVRLTIQASDNWEGLLTYTIARAGADPIISNHASGEEFEQEVTGLTAGTEYDFTVTVSDGVNNTNTHIVVTPVADAVKPVMGEASLASKTWNSAIINVAATDNKGVTAYYVAEKDADYVASEGKITIEGLTANTNYTLHIKAKDAAGNISDNQAEVSFATDAHSLVPTTAAPVPTWPAEQVKSIYSDAYALATVGTPNYNAPWWNAPAINLLDISGDHFMDYDLANDGMIGWQYNQISVVSMEKVHIDIYASAAGTVTIRPITDGDGALNDNRKTLTLAAQEWNSFDVDLAEFGAHDWSKLFQFAIEYWNAGGLTGEHISVDNVYFYRTTPPPADVTAPTDVTVNSTVAKFTSVTIKAQANDDSGVVHFKVLNGSDVLVADVEAVSGAEATIVVNGLAHSTAYNLSLIAYDEASHEAEPVAVVFTTSTAPAAAPVPTHDAKYVLSVYSNAYEPAVAASFNRSNWGSAPLALEEDYLLYSMSANVIVWGNNDGNAGHGNIDGLSGYTHGTTPGLDVSNMQYIHFDVWCDADEQLNTVNINDQAIAIPTTRTVAGQWVSFDVAISGVALADRQNLRWLKFHPFNTANCTAAIDNVYFYAVPEDVEFVDNGSNADLIETKHKHFVNATINRSFAANGEWFTLCLPFDMDAALINDVFGASTIAEMVGAEDRGSLIHLNFDYINEIKAGKAYLFKPGNDFAAGTTINGVQIKNVDPAALKSVNDYMEFEGTFSNKLLENDNQRFVGPENYLYSPAANGTNMKAFRCFFTIPEGPQQSNVMGKRARIVFGPQGTTDIDQINDQEPNTTGKLIIDGQLYIIRDGKTYNAQGMLVK